MRAALSQATLQGEEGALIFSILRPKVLVSYPSEALGLANTTDAVPSDKRKAEIVLSLDKLAPTLIS